MRDDVTVLAVGDVGAKREDLDSMFIGCSEFLSMGHFTFAQLETVITDRGAKSPNAKLAMRAPPGLAEALARAGINAVSFAGNHCLDWGYEGFGDTLDHLTRAGIGMCGAGMTRQQAIHPHLAFVQGRRIATIAASSILPEGYAAEDGKPGCAPMRAHTFYEQIEHDQPGTPARVRTYADRADLATLIEAIRAARDQADIVLLSLHWGIHMVQGSLAEYQREVGHRAIEAGADAILGHHPHILKGVEIYRGRPIFYSLGNFAIEQPHVWDPAITQTASFRHLVSLNPSWKMDQLYMLPDETRMTGVAQLSWSAKGVMETRFRPAWIDDYSVPHLLPPDDPRFEDVRNYLEQVSKSEGLATGLYRDGNALLVRPA